jgi:hypothetical protein
MSDLWGGLPIVEEGWTPDGAATLADGRLEPDNGGWRLYVSPDEHEYLRLDLSDILGVQPLPGSAPTCALVWIAPLAPWDYVHSGDFTRLRESLLNGALAAIRDATDPEHILKTGITLSCSRCAPCPMSTRMLEGSPAVETG